MSNMRQPKTRQMLTYWEESGRPLEGKWHTAGQCHRRKGWERWVHSPWRTEVNRDLLREYLMAGYRMDGDRALPYEVQNHIRGTG